MVEIWLPYVPELTGREILENPTESPIGRERRIQAVTLFGDVSGFTAMSEALGVAGKRGTEELTQILNSYFEPMIALIKRYGGIIGKFGGDAMTVLFPYTDDTQGEVIRRAVRCGLDMQRDMVRYEAIQTSAGVYALAMKVGIGMGNVYLTNVGDPNIRIEFIIAGEAIDECSDAEHHANKGEVVVTDKALPFIPDAELGEKREGFTLIESFDAQFPSIAAVSLPEISDTAQTILERYIHPTIAARLKVARSDFIDEHRKITLLFVNFSGFDYDNDPEIGAKLEHYAEAVIRIVNRYGGYLNKIDMGDKGSKYIVLFGAPVSYEDNEERALRCALDLQNLPDVVTRIGVNTGFVFAGHVGATTRREYTVMGDVVNLSARLMQASKAGETIVSDATYNAVANHFIWEKREPITVKGKSEPISIYQLKDVKKPETLVLREPKYQIPMVGRQRELALVQTKIRQALNGQGQIIGISGEAGMGKSRLNAEIIRLAFEAGMEGLAGACISYNTNLGYMVWHNIWRSYFELDANDPPEAQLYELETQIAVINPAYLDRLPLLGPVVNLPIPENDITRNLDTDTRKDILYSLLLDLLRYRINTHQKPLLLVLEDCHWMDALSRELAEFIGRNIANLPVLMVMLYRPLDAHASVHGARLMPSFSHFTEFQLDEFSEGEVQQLVNLKLDQLFDGAKLPHSVLERITHLANGNPFYIDELINYFKDQEVNIRDTQALLGLQLPDNLYTLIQSRIDKLNEDEKTVLKIASIIGRVFPARWIPGTYPEIGSSSLVIQHLNRLEALELTPLDRPDPELEYLFKHIMTQEVAYDGISYALRQELHERVGRYIEDRYSDRLEDYLFLVAFHFANSTNTDKQRIYFRQAGDHARSRFLSEAAVEYYERFLGLGEVDDLERDDVLFSLGQVQYHAGQWDSAQRSFREALTLAQGRPDVSRIAHRQNALGDALSYQQSYVEALDLLRQAEANFTTLNDAEGLNQVLKNLSFLYTRRGDYETVNEYARRHLQTAENARNDIARSDASQNLGIVALASKQGDEALTWFRQAADIAESAGYKQGVIYSLGNMSGAHVRLGNYAAAVESLNQALASAEEIGYTRAVATLIGNRGHIYEQIGRYEEALYCYEEALQRLVELGDYTRLLLFIGNTAQVLFKLQRYEDSQMMYAKATELARRLDMPFFLCEYLLGLGKTLAESGDLALARTYVEEGLTIAEEQGEGDIAFEARLNSIVMAVQAQEMDQNAGIEALQTIATSTEDTSNRAKALYEVWQLDTAYPQDTAHPDLQVDLTALYQEIYESSPHIESYERFTMLGGISENLTPLPELPPVETSDDHVSWQTLYEQGFGLPE